MGEHLRLREAPKRIVVEQLSLAAHIPAAQAEVLLISLETAHPIETCLSTTQTVSHYPPGSFGMMVMVLGYNLDISRLALGALLAILGFTPFSALLTLPEFAQTMERSVTPLTESERAVLAVLREFSGNGKKKLSRQAIYRSLTLSVPRGAGSPRPKPMTGAELNKTLDTLADKHLIELRTETIQVMK